MSSDNHKSSSNNPSSYSKFAKEAARFCGRPKIFSLAIGMIVLWVITGPIFDFSDTWQLVINTGTTIITFLMVFLIQNTQNRDTEAIQVKLDELIRATKGAHNALIDLEELEEDRLEEYRKKYQALADDARVQLERGNLDTDTPEPPLLDDQRAAALADAEDKLDEAEDKLEEVAAAARRR